MTAGGSFVALPPAPPLSELAQALADARVIEWCASRVSGVVVTFGASRWHILCPSSTTFDAAEALRLELVAKVPTGVVVDVQIAPSLPGELSAEDEAGKRLFGELRAARLAPVRPEVDEEPFPWDE